MHRVPDVQTSVTVRAFSLMFNRISSRTGSVADGAVVAISASPFTATAVEDKGTGILLHIPPAAVDRGATKALTDGQDRDEEAATNIHPSVRMLPHNERSG